tara:strand:- start:133 stop:387 length:255 start_codon:yes stop_codon:yes gene_type:complete
MTNKVNAIMKINPNAKFAQKADGSIEWLDGTTPISKSDIEAMIPTVETEIANAEANVIAKKASGKQKLLDLGLSEDEVKAMIGI